MIEQLVVSITLVVTFINILTLIGVSVLSNTLTVNIGNGFSLSHTYIMIPCMTYQIYYWLSYFNVWG